MFILFYLNRASTWAISYHSLRANFERSNRSLVCRGKYTCLGYFAYKGFAKWESSTFGFTTTLANVILCVPLTPSTAVSTT